MPRPAPKTGKFPWDATEYKTCASGGIPFTTEEGKVIGVCLWTCSCGMPSWYLQHDDKHGGPEPRASDKQYAFAQGPCWRSGQYGSKCATPKGWRIISHEGAPNPSEEIIAELKQVEKESRKALREAGKQSKDSK